MPAQLRVIPSRNSYGIVKAFPSSLHGCFILGMQRKMHVSCLRKIPPLAIVNTCHVMHLVVKHEALRVEPAGKPIHQKRHHIRFWIAAREPYIVLEVLEPNELLHKVPFVHNRATKFRNRAGNRMRQVLHKLSVLRCRARHHVSDETPNRHARRRIVRQRRMQHRFPRLAPCALAHSNLHAMRQGVISGDNAHALPQPRLQRAFAQYILRLLMKRVRLEYRRKQTFRASVIHIGNVLKWLNHYVWLVRCFQHCTVGLIRHAGTFSRPCKAFCQPKTPSAIAATG